MCDRKLHKRFSGRFLDLNHGKWNTILSNQNENDCLPSFCSNLKFNQFYRFAVCPSVYKFHQINVYEFNYDGEENYQSINYIYIYIYIYIYEKTNAYQIYLSVPDLTIFYISIFTFHKK